MHGHLLGFGSRAIVAAGLGALLVAGCSDDDTTTGPQPGTVGTPFVRANLVADVSGGNAAAVDANVVNAWGLAFGPTGILWVANNKTGTSTLYDASGTKQSLVVSIPGPTTASGGAPTGIVVNSSTSFVIPGAGAAIFIFAGEDGVISAWNPSLAASARRVADRSSEDAIYKGVAIAANGGENLLFATDFHNARVDVFDGSFAFVRSFTDATVPAGFAPFGIQAIGGRLYVTFAKQEGPDNEDDQPGDGNGFVDIFNADGTLVRRFASQGRLNSPWAVALAPAGFGSVAGDILIGNFGDGQIGAYDATTGEFQGFLGDNAGNAIAIDGLWGLTFGTGANAGKLYFAAGPVDETHGLVGTLSPM
jgi:uncharacterized protein (TIGR03118 family)